MYKNISDLIQTIISQSKHIKRKIEKVYFQTVVLSYHNDPKSVIFDGRLEWNVPYTKCANIAQHKFDDDKLNRTGASFLPPKQLVLNTSNFSSSAGASLSALQATVHPFPATAPSRCSDVYGLWAPCLCSLEMCIGWYPCGLKYCKGKTSDAHHGQPPNNASFRCGIKTCRKCTHFLYYVPEKQRCLWDD